MIVREGWRATVHRLEPPELAWIRSLLDALSLADPLDHAGAGFAFAGWLATAVRRGWLGRVVETDAVAPNKGTPP